MPRRSPLVVILISLWALLGPAAARAASFSTIDHPGGQGSLPMDVSADGKVVVGKIYDELVDDYPQGGVGFRWEDGDVRRLERCDGDRMSVSGDGATVAGGCSADTLAGEATVWNEGAGAYVVVPLAGDFETSEITLVSGDGLTLFGLHYIEIDDYPGGIGLPLESYEAFRVANGVPEVIGRLPDDLRSEPVAASFDGAAAAIFSYLQGFAGDEVLDEFHGARFLAGPAVSLQNLGASGEVLPRDISADGTTIVGDSSTLGGFRWRADTGMQALPRPAGALGVLPIAISGTGEMIVGTYADASMNLRAVIWTEADGALDLQNLLVDDFGLDLGGWQLTEATGVADDGSTIVGVGIDPASGLPSGWRVALRGVDFSFHALTRERGHVALDETVRYTATATPTAPALQLRITIELPRDTTVVEGSISQGGRIEGTELVWDFINTNGETVAFDLVVGPQAPGTLFVSSDARVQVAFAGGGEDSAEREIALRFAESNFDVADAHPDEMDGLLLPDARNARTLSTLDFSELRLVNGVAADGVALLLLRARVPRKDHGNLILSVSQSQYAGAETGDLWTPDAVSLIDASADGGTRDTMPDGAVSIGLESEPNRGPGARKGERVAFALYRAPRDFDAGDATAGVNERGVTIRLDVYDRKNKEIVEALEFELRVVRPLVVLQHGTFDAPAGWDTFPLWVRGGNQNKRYYGFDQEFPFQVARSQFNQVLGAAGPLVDSAPVAYRSLLGALADWRAVTGMAGSQADVVCHSYGGVNMRWAAQLQADPTPIAADAEGSFRNAGNWGHGAFHKLITIATTHRGSAVSNQLAYLNELGLVPGAIRQVAEWEKAWIDRGGVEDQMVLSPILRQLRRTRVPGHAIAGAGLADFNGSYRRRLASLWAADVENGPFRRFGPPFDFVDDQPVYSTTVLRALATYGFNLGDGFTVRDDTTQDPNFDLTVSSYSSKAGMPRSAQSDHRDVEDTAGLTRNALSGPLTHGDQIGSGGGNFFTTLATAKRVGFLLRQPTASTYFSAFPAAQEIPLSALEQEFSNVTSFPPAGLYRKVTDVVGGSQRSSFHPAAASTEPVLTVVPDVATVHPGDTLTVTVSWGDTDIESGFLAFPGSSPGTSGTQVLQADQTTHTVVVPNRSPGEITIGAVVRASGDETGIVSRTFELIDAAPYTTLRTDPEAVTIRSDARAPFQVQGRLPSGEWRSLDDSPRLVLTSSDPAVAAIDADGMVEPHTFGTATITATFDGGVSTQMPVVVSGSTVPTAAAIRKRGRVRRKAKKPSDFVFLSSSSFDPTTLDSASVLVGGVSPRKVKLKDVNKDSRKDLIALVSPRALQLAPGPGQIALTARTTDGRRVAGRATVLVK